MDPKQIQKVLAKAREGSVVVLTLKASLKDGEQTKRAVERLFKLCLEGFDMKLDSDDYFRLLGVEVGGVWGEESRQATVSVRRTFRLDRFCREIHEILDAVELCKL